jgi:hypothetical protein
LVKARSYKAEPPEQHINVNVTNRLVTVEDPRAAADLFSLILRAVRGEKADQEKKRNDSADS